MGYAGLGSPRSKPIPPSHRKGPECWSQLKASRAGEWREGWTWSTSSAIYQLCVAKRQLCGDTNSALPISWSYCEN